MAPPHRGPDVGFKKGREEGRRLGHLFVREKSPVVHRDLMHNKQTIGKYPCAYAKEHLGHEHPVSPKQHGSEVCGGGGGSLCFGGGSAQGLEKKVLRLTESQSYTHSKAGTGGCSLGQAGWSDQVLGQ